MKLLVNASVSCTNSTHSTLEYSDKEMEKGAQWMGHTSTFIEMRHQCLTVHTELQLQHLPAATQLIPRRGDREDNRPFFKGKQTSLFVNIFWAVISDLA